MLTNAFKAIFEQYAVKDLYQGYTFEKQIKTFRLIMIRRNLSESAALIL